MPEAHNKIYVYDNKSGHKVLNKNLVQVKKIENVEFIHPVDLMHPRFILSPSSKVVEGQIIYAEQFARYYVITAITTEHNRFLVDCDIDVLSTYLPELMEVEHVILDRVSMNSKDNPSKKLANFYLQDNEIDVLAYPFIETHDLTASSGTPFSNKINEFILVITGGVSGS